MQLSGNTAISERPAYAENFEHHAIKFNRAVLTSEEIQILQPIFEATVLDVLAAKKMVLTRALRLEVSQPQGTLHADNLIEPTERRIADEVNNDDALLNEVVLFQASSNIGRTFEKELAQAFKDKDIDPQTVNRGVIYTGVRFSGARAFDLVNDKPREFSALMIDGVRINDNPTSAFTLSVSSKDATWLAMDPKEQASESLKAKIAAEMKANLADFGKGDDDYFQVGLLHRREAVKTTVTLTPLELPKLISS